MPIAGRRWNQVWGCIAAVVVGVSLCVAPRSVAASIAPSPPPHVVFTKADVVFVGVVTEVTSPTMTVRPDRVLKGKPEASIKLVPITSPSCTPGSSSGSVFKPGERLFVAAAKEAKFYRLVDHMVGNAKLANADEEKRRIAFAEQMIAVSALPSAEAKARAFVAWLPSDSAWKSDAAAEFVLSELRTPAAARPHAAGLVAGLKTEVKWTRYACLAALRALAPKGGFDAIAAFTRSPDRAEAEAACGALAAYDRPDAVTLIRKAAARCKNPYMLTTLGDSPRPEARKFLRRLLLGDPGQQAAKQRREAALRGYARRLETQPAADADVDDLLAFLRSGQGVRAHDFQLAIAGTHSLRAAGGLLKQLLQKGVTATQCGGAYRGLHSLGTDAEHPELAQAVVEKLRQNEAWFVQRLDGGDEDMYLCWILGLIHTEGARAALRRRQKLDPPNQNGHAWRTLHFWDE